MDKQNNSKNIDSIKYDETTLKQIEKLMEELKNICGGDYQIAYYPCCFNEEYIKYRKINTKPILEVYFFSNGYELLFKKNERVTEIIRDIKNFPGVVFSVSKTDR